jgi:penicillin-binding protein 2
VGKTGLEKEYESYLRGTKGSETVTVNTGNRVVDVVDRIDPVAGNDIYLTIDADLQKSVYHILEKRIAGILLSKIVPDLNYGSKGESASEITIPIYEVYYALIDNNIIDITHLNDKDAKDLEHQVYDLYRSNLENVFSRMDSLLALDNTVTNNKAEDMEDYLDYFYKILVDKGILLEDSIPAEDAKLKDYQNDRLPLSGFLQYAISNNYIDLSKLDDGGDYFSTEEWYQKLLSYTKDLLQSDGTFNKKIYRDLVFSYKLSGKEICLLLFDQGVLEYKEEDVNRLKSGSISAYDFMKAKLTSLEITPAMLALEPCSGSVVVTDVKTGDLLAMVTYPSYDNNKLANKVDSAYYNWLFTDKSLPWMNRPVQQRTAPGSTFKMVTSFAGLEEGVISTGERIRDLGIFEKIQPAAKCHIYPGSHGNVDLVDAIKVSCNYFFYEVGYRLSIDGSGKYNEEVGLEKLKKYASLFGLDTTSGVELNEALPQVSDDDPVRSAIGQGTNAYTPIQLSRYVTTLANRGINYDLTLLDRIVDKDGNIKLHNSATIYKDLTDIDPSYWDTVQKGMYSVVNVPGGSVYNSGVYKNFGVTVAGKTGTSQISKVNFNNALFVSYAPYENPEISVTTVIPNGVTSGNAAELTSDIYRLYFHLKDPEELVEKEASLPENNIAAFSD